MPAGIDRQMVASQDHEPLPQSALGAHLRQRFETIERERQLIEEEWLKSLRQYMGIYEPEDMPDSHAGSRAFIRLTRTKVRSADARMLDVLFPAGQKNWTATCSPTPNLAPELVNQLLIDAATQKLQGIADELAALPPEAHQQMLAEGSLPDLEGLALQLQQGAIPPPLTLKPEEIDALIDAEGKRRAERMEDEIDDQLRERYYRRTIKQVIHAGNLYGTGWLKGPLAEQRQVTRWAQGQDGQWQAARRAEMRPFPEFVPVWDVYPDALDVNELEQCEGIFQRYVMTKPEVRALKRRPYFKGETIDRYLAAHPAGDAPQYRRHEGQLRELRPEDQGTLHSGRARRYELLEYTGYADAQLLAEAGIELPHEATHTEFKACVWLLGDQVIKAVLYPYDDAQVQTYHRYVFEESDTGLFGIGIPEIYRDPQRMFNAAVRAALDNMGHCVGPLYEINASLLDPSNLPTAEDMKAFSVIFRTGEGAQAGYPAIRTYETNSRLTELLALGNLARELGDEATALPRYTAGNEQAEGAAETASGLSMLMGQANVMMKEAIANFDEGVTRPFITAMCHWNMQFNPREDIKGDFEIAATGSTSLMAKELYTQRIEEFARNTLNPVDGAWIKRGELNRERAKANELEADRFVLTDAEHARQMEQTMQAQAARTQAPPGGNV